MNPIIPIAVGNNRLNSSNVILPTGKNRTSRFINNVVAAGDTIILDAQGTAFYLTVASAELEIKPSGGSFNRYVVGTGLELSEANAFYQLEIHNPASNPGPVAFQIFVGFDRFIDKRVFMDNLLTPNVGYPTYPKPNVLPVVDIPDLSGTVITDINGKDWYAVNRVCINVFNVDAGATFAVLKKTALLATDEAIGAVYPQTSVRLDICGDYRITAGGGNINAIVSEFYTCLEK